MHEETEGVWKARCREIIEFSRLHVDVQDEEREYGVLAEKLARAVGAQAVSIFLLSDARDSIVRAAYYGSYSSYLHTRSVRSFNVGRVREILESSTPFPIDFEHPHPRDSVEETKHAFDAGFRCGMNIPLRYYEERLGYATVIFTWNKTWDDDEMEYITLIGQALASYIKHTQRVRRSIEFQVLEERSRISREVHDNLSQLACALKIAAERVLVKAEDGEEITTRDLLHLTDTSANTVKALRDEMLFLRIPLGEEDDGFIEGCRECLENYRHQWDIETTFTVDLDDGIHVPSPVAVHFTRILRECLSNVIRHAEASRVDVLLDGDRSCMRLTVTDDGVGFDPQAVPDGHLGIQLMTERVNQMHGRLRIDSAPGAGTSVRAQAYL